MLTLLSGLNVGLSVCQLPVCCTVAFYQVPGSDTQFFWDLFSCQRRLMGMHIAMVASNVELFMLVLYGISSRLYQFKALRLP